MSPHTSRRQFLAALGALVALGACGRGAGDGSSSGAGRETGPSSTRAPSRSTVADAGPAHLAFAAELYRTVAATMAGNLALSPYSVASGLAMSRNGASGQTGAELDTVLRAGSLEDLNAQYAALAAALASRAGPRPGPGGDPVQVELVTANRLFGDKATNFRQDFLDRLANEFAAPIERVDYGHDPEAARNVINRWVSDRTKQRIPQLLPPDMINKMTRLVLTNAIYFKAPWSIPFKPTATRPMAFHRLDGTTVDVPFMSQTVWASYAEGDGWTAVELPYAGGQLAMTVVLPAANGFSALDSGLSGGRLADVAAALEPREVDLRLPRWTFRTQAPLNSVLRAMGIETAFDPNRADFSAMTAERLFISAVVHEAFVAVDEAGTEAAAATAVVQEASSARVGPRVLMTVDRPFLFLIRDRPTGEALFLGRVVDPSAS